MELTTFMISLGSIIFGAGGVIAYYKFWVKNNTDNIQTLREDMEKKFEERDKIRSAEMKRVDNDVRDIRSELNASKNTVEKCMREFKDDIDNKLSELKSGQDKLLGFLKGKGIMNGDHE